MTKISRTKLTSWGKNYLKLLHGTQVYFTDTGTLTLKGNKLVNSKGKVWETLDTDIKVNKLIFHIL